jgi:translocation and assembly module TamA
LRSCFKPLRFLILLGLPLGSAHALEVRIDAPPELASLLQAHLETARVARLKEPLTLEELERLQRVSLQTAQDLLATEGYFSPRIEDALQHEGSDHGACLAASAMAACILQYRVEPGPRTLVSKVDIRFAGAVSESGEDRDRVRSRVRHRFVLKPEMPFRQADWESAKSRVLRPLLVANYPAARIAESAARVDPDRHTAELSLMIDSGPAFYYGPVEISGNQRYPAEIASNLSPVKAGQPYREQDMLDYQKALAESGYYVHGAVTIDPDPARAAAAPVRVTLEEKPARLLSVGAGYSTDTGARVQAAYERRDFLERSLILKLDATLETKQQDGGAALTWPRESRGYQDSLGLRLEHTDIEQQFTESKMLVGSRGRKRGDVETTLSLQYLTERQDLNGELHFNNKALMANYAWTQRTVRQVYFPVEGYVLSLQAGGAAEALLSDQSFIRLYGRYTHYSRLGDKGRLILRAELGGVLASSPDGIPTAYLFRAGGDNSVRGYAYQSLGKDIVGAVQSVPYLATASAEYNYFFTRTWGMAVFMDAGDAADSFASLSPAVGVGLGVRYRSPVGPLNLDLAYGEATGEFHLHFALGVSF